MKSFNWVKYGNDKIKLVFQRSEPSGLSTVLYSDDLYETKTRLIYSTDVKDVFFKGDYIFTTKHDANGTLQLYVSHKLDKPPLLCVFASNLTVNEYFVVDVSGDRALIVGSNSEFSSTLYVSDDLNGSGDVVQFTVSLPDVFCYFPNKTWHNSWLR